MEDSRIGTGPHPGTIGALEVDRSKGRSADVTLQTAKSVEGWQRLWSWLLAPAEQDLIDVPAADVPGERSWPTQPFPTVPLPPVSLSADDAYGLTAWDRGRCRALIERYRNDGIFTPPSFGGSIEYPGIGGGTNWGSVAFEPTRGIVVLNMMHVPFVRKCFVVAVCFCGV